mmetsp:Transcript_3999/g.4541  ORF Transcript_3999/g.4541 Transcript_3999/m.4541 type:complete len:575 (-) Transcript_3999:498-2222(-)|eukprot:CAMPEP_0197845220 /NCGR_PEP_ID=MMETSP1438-20131217/2168_1 /TAXON_ID=1461541 /ORGANISM="Pterosperma sp., Strain CCMP1384" /LENGTH=574 /DNA_ID=CAMNT_0043456407 /DNA_START=209 /DNA_END=1933 /DNA_ORIENTATION=-
MGCTASVPAVSAPLSKSVPISESVKTQPKESSDQTAVIPPASDKPVSTSTAPAAPAPAPAPPKSETTPSENKENRQTGGGHPDPAVEKPSVTGPPLSAQSSEEKSLAPIEDAMAEARKKLPPLEISNTLDGQRSKLPELKPLGGQLLPPAGGLGAPGGGLGAAPLAKKSLPPVGGSLGGLAPLAPLGGLEPIAPKKPRSYVDEPPPNFQAKAPAPLKDLEPRPSPAPVPEPVPRERTEPAVVEATPAASSMTSLGGLPALGSTVDNNADSGDEADSGHKRRVSFAEQLESVRTITPLASPAQPMAGNTADDGERSSTGIGAPVAAGDTSLATSSMSDSWDPLPGTGSANTTSGQLESPDRRPATDEDGDDLHAAIQLAGRWQLNNGDVLELATTGNGAIGGSVQGKRSGNMTGSARFAHVFKGHTRKEDMSIRLILSKDKTTFRGYYYAKAQPDLGCLWDATTTATITHPFAANWEVKDLGEDVTIALNLEALKAEAPESLSGQFVIPGEDGGVRVSGKASQTVPVANLKLDNNEVLVATDGETLMVWMASADGEAIGDVRTASRARDELDFIP